MLALEEYTNRELKARRENEPHVAGIILIKWYVDAKLVIEKDVVVLGRRVSKLLVCLRN